MSGSRSRLEMLISNLFDIRHIGTHGPIAFPELRHKKLRSNPHKENVNSEIILVPNQDGSPYIKLQVMKAIILTFRAVKNFL